MLASFIAAQRPIAHFLIRQIRNKEEKKLENARLMLAAKSRFAFGKFIVSAFCGVQPPALDALSLFLLANFQWILFYGHRCYPSTRIYIHMYEWLCVRTYNIYSCKVFLPYFRVIYDYVRAY